MKKRNAFILTGLAGAAMAALVIFVVSTLGGCGGPSAGVIAAIGAGSQQDNPDNPVFPLPPGHPMRIVFRSNRDAATGNNMIWAMKSDGSLVTVVAKTKNASETPAPSERSFDFMDPAMSQTGFNVYYASDYYTPTTNIIKTGITNTAQINVVQQDVNLVQPRVSWDETKVAFVGYTTKEVTAILKPEKQVTTTEADSLIWMEGGGKQISTRLDASSTDFGLLMIDATGLTECPAPCAPRDPDNPPAAACSDDTASEYYIYGKNVIFTPVKGRYNFSDSTYPVGKTICLNMDGTNFLIMEVTDYQYGYTKEAGYVCSTTSDTHCEKSVFSANDFICTSQGICMDDAGGYTTKICTSSDDCGGNTCDTELRCLTDTGKSASITFDWSWVEQTISGTNVTSVSPVVEDADPITISDTLKSDKSRDGGGVNLIQTFDFRTYDLYTADMDGSNIVKHMSDDIAQLYPCFSPTSPDVVFYTRAEASSAYLDPDDPAVSEIYKLIISTGETEKVFSSSQLVRHCSFNPSGTKMAYSQFNGSDYDIYIYDLKTDTSSFVLDTGGDDLYPSFSPTGASIAFQSDETNDNDIYTTNLAGTIVKNLSNNRTIEDTTPAWSP